MPTPPTIIDIRGGLRTTLIVETHDPVTGAVKRVERNCRTRTGKPFGCLIHTTGGGPAKRARLMGTTLAQEIHRVYGNRAMTYAHRVAMPDGSIIRCATDTLVAPHCGVKAWQRTAMLNGTWREHVSDRGEKLWGMRWPGVKSPQHIYPTSSPNDAYLGIENAQLDAVDLETNTRFTAAQYMACAWQIVEWERTFGFVAEGRRLTTHEDVQPFERWDASGGWDPGVIRDKPTYDWARLLRCIELWREAAPARAA